MSFRSNVQRAGASTTRYSGTANVSARKTPRGQASITRAGEVVIKQGTTTTYIPPATFSSGKAAYQRYEAIKSVQGESAASQMAKEVAKGNLQPQGISKPSISYARSIAASQQYRLDRESGMQTISGSIGVEGNLASGIQSTSQTPPQTSRTPESNIKYHTITPKQPTETMAQRLKRAPPNITEYATMGTSEKDQVAFLGMSAGFSKKYAEAQAEMGKSREIQVPKSRWGTSSMKYGEVNEIGQIVKPPAGVGFTAAEVSINTPQYTFGKSLYEPAKKELIIPEPTTKWGTFWKEYNEYWNTSFKKAGLDLKPAGSRVASAILPTREDLQKQRNPKWTLFGNEPMWLPASRQQQLSEDYRIQQELNRQPPQKGTKNLERIWNLITGLKRPQYYAAKAKELYYPTSQVYNYRMREEIPSNVALFTASVGVGSILGAGSSHLRAIADIGGLAGKVAKGTAVAGKVVGLGLGGYYVYKTGKAIKEAPSVNARAVIIGTEAVRLPIITAGLGIGSQAGKQWYSKYQWRHAKYTPLEQFSNPKDWGTYESAPVRTHMKAFIENPYHPTKAQIKLSDRYGTIERVESLGGKKELPFLIKSKAGTLSSNTYNALLSQKGEGASMRTLKMFGDTNQWREFPQWKLPYYKPKPVGYHGGTEELGLLAKAGESEIQGIYMSRQMGTNFWGIGNQYGFNFKDFFKLRGSPRSFIITPEQGFKIGKPDIKVGKQSGWSDLFQFGKAYVPMKKTEIESIIIPENPLTKSILWVKTKYEGYDAGILTKTAEGGVRTPAVAKTNWLKDLFSFGKGNKGIDLKSSSSVDKFLGTGQYSESAGKGGYGSSLGYGLSLSTLFGTSKGISLVSSSASKPSSKYLSSSKVYGSYSVPLSSYKSYSSSKSSYVPSPSPSPSPRPSRGSSTYSPPSSPPPSSPPYSPSRSSIGGIEIAPPIGGLGFSIKGGLRQKNSWNRFYYFERTHKIMSPESVMRMMFGGGSKIKVGKLKGRRK